MKSIATSPRTHEFRQAQWVVVASYFSIGLADPNAGLWQLPLQWLLKERMHLGAEDVAWFFAAALTPWYFKPLAGLLSDSLPLFGSRRRTYLLAGAVGAALASFALVSAPAERFWLLACVIPLHASLMLVNTVTGGLLVETGQRSNATGRLTSWRSIAESAAALCAGPLGGWLAGVRLGVPAGISVGLALSMLSVFAIKTRGETPIPTASRSIRSVVFTPMATLLRSRGVWIATALLCCYQVAPGFQTPLFYLQRDALGFTPRFLGTVALASAVSAVVGAAAYAWCCPRMDFRRLFPAAILVGIVATLSFLAYHTALDALIIGAVNGIAATFAFIALLDLIARAMPKDFEALGYAFVFSFGNLASSASDILGSRWFDSGMSFQHLVWINASTTGLILLAIPFLPKGMMCNTVPPTSGRTKQMLDL